MSNNIRSSYAFLVAATAFATVLSSVARAEPSSQDVAKQVDRTLGDEVFSGQPSENLAPLVNDETYLRRVYLDLIGELPTTEDIIAFSLDPDPDKRAKVVDSLLNEQSFGENWGRYWRDVIMYRRSEPRAIIAAEPLTQFLSDQLNSSTGWDAVARSIVTATGDVRENGETGLIMAQGGQPEDTVAEISRIFMGVQIQCAQCHDHPYDRWKREQFHELAAFFPRVAVRPTGDGTDRSFAVVATDFQPRFARPNNNNRFAGTLEHHMPNLEDPSDRGTLVHPVFFATDQKLTEGTRDSERRGKLAEWMTSNSNPWFAKAYVNRMWSELVGEGFYEPVDDMGPDRDCSAPETLAYLSEQFIESGYDAKWLFRTITATETYQRESRARRNADESPFLANCSQRLRGDQLYSELVSVLEIPERNLGGRRGPYGLNAGPRLLFNQAFGYDPSERREEIKSSIPQALAMMNSPFVSQWISARPGTMLGRLLYEVKDDESLVVELYLKALSRQPTDDEIKTCLDHVQQVDDRAEAFEDILWALVNSTEFLHRR